MPLEEGDSSLPRGDSQAVGALAWTGFAIVNFAVWGIINYSAEVAWPIGFSIGLLYTSVVCFGAQALEQRDALLQRTTHQPIVNLLWVLGCGLVLFLGVWLSFHLVGPGFGYAPGFGYGEHAEDGAVDLAALLPKNSSSDLIRWVSSGVKGSSQRHAGGYAVIGGQVFFSAWNDQIGENVLMHSDAQSVNSPHTEVVMPQLLNPASFAQLNPETFCLAAGAAQGVGNGLWCCYSGSKQGVHANDSCELITSDVEGPIIVQDIFVDSSLEAGSRLMLYIKVAYEQADGKQMQTVFKSDGTRHGTHNLDRAAVVLQQNGSRKPSQGTDSLPLKDGGFHLPPRPTFFLVSTLFIGVLPHLFLAAAVAKKKRMPGMVLNIFVGLFLLALNLYLLCAWPEDDEEGREGVAVYRFVKVFLTIYSSIALVAIAVAAERFGGASERFEWTKTWAVTIVGLTFSSTVLFLLGIFWGNAAWWEWLIYAVVGCILMLYSILVSRMLPMLLGCLSTCHVLRHVANAVVDSLGLGGGYLTELVILALLGGGVLVMAVQYVKIQEELESKVRGLLFCFSRGSSAINDGSGNLRELSITEGFLVQPGP